MKIEVDDKELTKHGLNFVYILVALLSIIIVSIYFITRPSLINELDLSETGQIGDTIGGISSPIIGILVSILTFFAFIVQYIANVKQNEQFEIQKHDGEKQQCIDRVMQLIAQHRIIANEIHIKDIKGAKCLKYMCSEFKATYEITKSVYDKILDNNSIINISYIIFYNGIGLNSNEINRSLISNYKDINLLIETISQLKKDDFSNTNINFELNASMLKPLNSKVLKYKALDGHQTRLGHYFRSLFHVLQYTSQLNHLNEIEKYEIIKTIRTQMSSYEQILIHFNSLSVYGRPFIMNNFIEKYKLVKNIPFPMVNYAGDIRDHYLNIDFEWEEIEKLVNNNQI